MKHILLTFMLLLGLIAQAADGPRIEFKETKHDFGTVAEDGGQVLCEYEFTNTGDEPLVIVTARSSCGCTHPSYPQEPIAPGQTSKISVKFNPRHQMGEVNKTVTVRTNDKKHRKVTLRLTGVVKSPPAP